MLKIGIAGLLSAFIAAGAAAQGAAMDFGVKNWTNRCLSGALGAQPFSFTYGGKTSKELMAAWPCKTKTERIGRDRSKRTTIWTDTKTGLQVRCESIAYKNYPTVEWTVYLKNNGNADTPIIENLLAADISFSKSSQDEYVLRYLLGDSCAINSYEPHEVSLAPNERRQFAPAGGKPTKGAFPYYNIGFDGGGVLAAIGWPGQWSCKFERDGDSGLIIEAGQELAHFVLHPGEEVRTPLFVLQFYKGDWIDAQNVWRKWMFECNFPKDHGKPLVPKSGAASVQYYNFRCTQQGDIEFIDHFKEKKVPTDYWWMDAGWYPNTLGWFETGNWEVDTERFPGGIKAISERCHQSGIELLVWFEIERVRAGTWLANNHPEWIRFDGKQGLLKMDDPSVVKWATDLTDRLIAENGIDYFRSDFNIDPLPFWRKDEPEDRQGITENKYIQGYLAYWDGLRKRYPGMMIDSCASGGQRNDLETMRRSVPLLISDFEGNPEGNQCHAYGCSFWLPYFNEVHNWSEDSYAFRSAIAPFLQRNWDLRKPDFPAELANKYLSEWRKVAGYWLHDYYPLTSHSTANDAWIAWQFHDSGKGEGVVQAFRRKDNGQTTLAVKLRGLVRSASYEVKDADSGQIRKATGKTLMERGLELTIEAKPGAAVWYYRRIK